MILVFSEKPSLTRMLFKPVTEHYQKIYPEHRVVFITSLYFSNAPYSYAKRLTWKDFPYIQEENYEFKSWEHWQAMAGNELGDLERVNLHTHELSSVKEFLFAGDPSGFSAQIHAQLIKTYFCSLAPEKQPDYRSIFLYALNEGSIEEALNNKGEFFSHCAKILNCGKIYNYFTYNFNLNSFALLAPALKQVQLHDVFISKYMLQLLYWFKNNPQWISFGQAIQAMSKWRGTGKYPPNSAYGIGSSASRWTILDNLIQAGLLCQFQPMSGTGAVKINISQKGLLFLSLLHKDCEDQDLPFRLEQWAAQPFETVKPKIDTYLHTFFGKQKRKMSASHS